FNFSTASTSLASITWSGGATLRSELNVAVLASALTTSVSIDSTVSTTGTIAATFSAPDKTFDFLAAGETLTITYNVTVTDNTGASLTQPVTITITGSNDPPMLAADASGPHITTQAVNTSGALTFTDVDLTDHHTVSTSVTSATWPLGVTPPRGIDAVLAGALSTTVADSTGSGSGLIVFTFGPGDALDFLAAGQKLTITYNVTVTDNNGASSTQAVTITVIGTNDAPVVTSAQNGAVTEHVNVDNSGNLDTGGIITFTEVHLTANHPVTFTPDGNNYLGTFTPTLTQDATGGSTGVVGWTFSVSEKTVEFLAAGQTLTQTYTVQVADNNGGFTTQDVTITITGTNEAPVITSGVQSGVVTEIAGGAPGENTAPHSLSGAVTFTDVDLSDIETSSITNTQVVATLANGYALTAAQQNALVNAFTIDAATHSTTDGSGSIGWHYNVNDSALDF